MKRTAAVVLATLISVGILAAPAQARDTTWSCPTCITHQR